MTLSYFKKLLNKNSFVYSILIGLCILTYGSILGNEFTVVDDIPTFIDNETIRSFISSLKTFQLQIIIYSIFYNLFGTSPIPLHIMSISLHIANAILLFTILKLLFSSKVAILSALLFTVHPINTEAITWISGNPYLFNALVFNLCLLTYIWYKKTKQKKYLMQSLGIFIGGMILIQTIWLVTIPLVIFVIEQGILEKEVNLKLSKYLLLFILPPVVFGTLYIGIKGTQRLSTRSMEKPMNQQSLKPVLEGAPYTIFTMSRLYIFPKDLMIYYDGNPVGSTYYISMYLATLLYGIAILYLWNKNRSVSAILIILIILLAPTYSPIKVAWFLSERYLYYGTGLFCTLLAFLIIWLGRKTRISSLPFIMVLILVSLYFVRTLIRNAEFKNSATLAQATIRTSPMSIRGYDDLGGDYLMKGNYKAALPLYRKTLTLLPDSNTAISNLGYIYALHGIPQTANDRTEHRSSAELFELGNAYYKQGKYTNAFYYLYQSTLADPMSLQSKERMGDIYIKVGRMQQAEDMYNSIISEDPEYVAVYSKIAYVAFQKGEYDVAKKYLQEALKRQPDNKNIIDNLKLVEQTKL